MEDQRTRIYLFVILLSLILLLVFANFIPPDETRNIITVRIALLSGAVIVGLFTLFSFLGKWG
jgi:prepilin signal peptidase PulO-like enzyme (type II secretory pathway)